MKVSLQEIEEDLRQTRELAQERLELLEQIFEFLRHSPEPDIQGAAARLEEYLQTHWIILCFRRGDR